MIILCNMYRIYQELTFVTCVSMPIFETNAWGGGTGGGVGWVTEKTLRFTSKLKHTYVHRSTCTKKINQETVDR